MRKYAGQQFSFLLLDLAACKAKEMLHIKETESSFNICKSYWLKMEAVLSKHQFNDSQEEIEFFKIIKPRFIAEIEYYNLLYHAEALRKLLNPTEEVPFWTKESLRLEQFVNENEVIYTYMKDESSYNDEVYFVRRRKILNHFLVSVHHLDPLTSTSHDHFVSTIIALERYVEYAHNQLKVARLKTQVSL